MPKFVYKARTTTQELVEGVLDAGSASLAVRKLGAMGYYPTSLEKDGAPAQDAASAKPARIPISELSVCLRQLSDLLEAGRPLASALGMAAEQCVHAALQAVLRRMETAVREGKTLSEAMNEAGPNVFASFFVHQVLAGETGGMLGKVLARLADFAEGEAEIRSQIQSALAYPAFIAAVGFGTIGYLLGAIIPRMAGLFADFQQLLPLPTRVLLALSGIFRSYFWIVLPVAAVGWLLLRRFGSTERLTRRFDGALLKIPAVRDWIRARELAQFARTLGSLLQNGVPILKALEITEQAMGNRAFRESVAALREPVRRGVPLSKALANARLFPPYVRNLAAVGEEGGALDKALLKAADVYERDARRGLKTAMSLLEPSLILVVGLILGGVVISIMLPIFEINTLIR